MSRFLNVRGVLILALTALVMVSPALCQTIGSDQADPNPLLYGVNAYNPIPSPDGRTIAFVGTGWGRHLPTSGLGRSHLTSDVMLMDVSGRVLTSKPLADAFLHGWTPDGKKLVCYRDWKAFLVALDGTQSDFVDVGRGVYSERAEYFATRHSFCWNWGRGPQLLEWDIVCSDGSVLVRKDSFLTDLMVPSPDERYLAVLGASGPVGTTKDNNLWVYDRSKESWANLGKIIISPDPDWDYIKPSWNPWFADSSRLAFIKESGVVVAAPDGSRKHVIAQPDRTAGLAVPSPDGKHVAYATFEGTPMEARPDLTFWGRTTIWVVPVNGSAKPRPVTRQAPETTYCLRWLSDSELVFDRVADEMLYRQARIWKTEVPAN